MKKLITTMLLCLAALPAFAGSPVYGRGAGSGSDVEGRMQKNGSVYGRQNEATVVRGGRTFGEVVLSNANLVAYWPLRADGAELKAGNTMLNTNVTFTGQALYNGTTAYSRTTTSLDLSAYSKITLVADIALLEYNLTASEMIAEFSVDATANAGAFQATTLGATANDPMRVLVRGDAGNNLGYYYPSTTGLSDVVSHTMAFVFDFTQVGNSAEVDYYQDGNYMTKTVNASSNNTGAFGNYPLFVAAKGGASQFNYMAVKNMALFSTVLTSKEIGELHAAQ